MQAGQILKVGLSGMALIALVGCEEGAPFGQQTFRAQYAVARQSLENGQYEKAGRSYQRLLEQAGPLAPRIRLEYAHTLLRQGDFPQAAAQAGSLVQGSTGAARAAALAVQATAEHEMALQFLAQGDRVKGKQYLIRADKGMAEVLKKHPEMDPIGSLAARRASIKVRKAAL
ncbi:hypothetical protein RXV86_00330 [Alisedimentitalea sp. MJ-SS2]|uniref:hypothetical protein n=1 Tax=Aliisedimentitalea sp. MJ-SS2 TaxID=3049795 RepID=UPI00290F379E|nr:hypothetical protein [Alisedimentitalea sp. MJ-SS2]MDU8925822.1 hypothetical protein [Alisedimentitalea sp. MJ-SS2]